GPAGGASGMPPAERGSRALTRLDLRSGGHSAREDRGREWVCDSTHSDEKLRAEGISGAGTIALPPGLRGTHEEHRAQDERPGRTGEDVDSALVRCALSGLR